jgi:hypothetical protein
MQATRILRSSSSSSFGAGLQGQPKLLLPAQTFWPSVFAAYQGAWTLMTEDSARVEFNKAIKNQIIKEKVLQNSALGSMITFSLFHNLQDPLFQKHKWDAQEFVAAIGPALENFHETLGLLRNQLPDHILRETREREEKEKAASAEASSSTSEEGEEKDVLSDSNMTEALLGTNYWRLQAEEDPDSPAGQLARMSTEVCLDAFYYTSKLDTICQSFETVKYVPGSCDIHQVALLNARALEIYPESNDELTESAANEMDEDPPIAAQMDVMYEVTHTYKQTIGGPGGPVIMEAVSDEDATGTTTPAEKKDDEKEEEKTETVSYTTLAVAVLEGWLHKGPEKELRWKVAMLRDAIEFPHHPPSVKRH